MDFETRNNVTIPEYLQMIEYKTAVLIAAAMQMGAIVANAPQDDQNKIYDFGKNLGIAFQLQDDYLDAFGNPETFGKQIGGDIIENKKTYLYLKAIAFSSEEQKKELIHLYNNFDGNNIKKIETVKHIFIKSSSAEVTKKAIKDYTKKAYLVLEALNISSDKKSVLRQFAVQLMGRDV